MAASPAHPAKLFGMLALAEMATWTLLLLGMLGKYALGLGDLGVRVGGSLHGFVFLSYCLVTVLIAVDQRWRLRDAALGIGSAVVPYATVPFERYAQRNDLLANSWRLRGQRPEAPQERVVSAALRQPILAGLASLLVVAAAFFGLVRLGPPTQWFS